MPWAHGESFSRFCHELWRLLFFTRECHQKQVINNCIWVAIWQNQQNDCAPSEDSDQPGHSPSLIKVFAVRMKKAWVFSYPLSTQRRLWSDWADAQADLSLRWVHTHFVGFVMSWLILELLSNTVPYNKVWFTRFSIILQGSPSFMAFYPVQSVYIITLYRMEMSVDPKNSTIKSYGVFRYRDITYERHHEKTWLWHMQTTNAQADQRLCHSLLR